MGASLAVGESLLLIQPSHLDVKSPGPVVPGLSSSIEWNRVSFKFLLERRAIGR